MSRTIVVVTAGLSVPSSTRLLGDQLADATAAAVGARGEAVSFEHVEVRELAQDLAGYMSSGLASPRLTAVREQISAADGLIAVTPVFSASFSGLFKMFIDALDPDALNAMPVLIAATAGSARHSLVLDHAMRPMFSYLRAVVLPTGVFAATEDFGDSTESGEGLAERIARAAAELANAVVVAGADHVAGFAPDPTARRRTSGTELAPVADFAELLRGHAG